MAELTNTWLKFQKLIIALEIFSITGFYMHNSILFMICWELKIILKLQASFLTSLCPKFLVGTTWKPLFFLCFQGVLKKERFATKRLILNRILILWEANAAILYPLKALRNQSVFRRYKIRTLIRNGFSLQQMPLIYK